MRDKQGILGVVQLADSKKKVRLDLLHLAMLILMTVLYFLFSESDARSSSSTGQRHTHPTDDRVSFDGSFSSRNFSDSSRGTDAARHPPNHNHQQHSQSHPDQGHHHHHHLQHQQQPGGQLLTSNELQLCSSLNLPVTRYLSLKTVLLGRPSLDHGISSVAETMVKKYLIRSGWLQTSPQN